jgi:hypothetical protein
LPPDDRPLLAAAVDVDKPADVVALDEAIVEEAVFVVEGSVCVCVTTTTVDEEEPVVSASDVVEDVEDEDVEVVVAGINVEVDDVVELVVGTEVVEDVLEVDVEVVDGTLIVLVVCSLVVLLVVGIAEDEEEEEEEEVIASVDGAAEVVSGLVAVVEATPDMAKRFELTSAKANRVQPEFLRRTRVRGGMRSSKHSNRRREKGGTNRDVAPGALKRVVRIGISKLAAWAIGGSECD